MVLKLFWLTTIVVNFINAATIIRREEGFALTCNGFTIPGSNVRCTFSTPTSSKGNYIRLYKKNGNIDATADRSVRCPSNSGEVFLATSVFDSGLWIVDLVNMDTWTVPVSQTVEVSASPRLGFSLSCESVVEPGKNVNCKCQSPLSGKGNYLRIYKIGNVDATADRSLKCPPESGEVSLATSIFDSGLWTVDLVNIDTWTVPASQSVAIIAPKWELKCTWTGPIVNCNYETKGPRDSSYIRIHQNSDVDRTADRNVRCVERVGQINLNSVGLRNGPWTVDMVNIITSEIVVSTTVYINNINKVDLSKFELHLPLSRKAGGKMSIINSLELRNGFSLPPYFYFDSITSAYVFHTPVWFDGAVTSSGSDYIRTELRQEANWNALLSQQTLTALQSVNSVSQNGVFVGQILADFNGKHSPVLYIGLKPNSANPSLYDLKAFVNEYNENSLKINTSTFILKSSYVLGTTFEIKIRVGQGAVSIYYNGDLKTVDYNTKFSSGIFGNVYYKTGSYGQTKRTDDLNINNQVSEVSIYKLEISN